MHTRRLKTIRLSISATCLMGLTSLAATPVLEFGGDDSYVESPPFTLANLETGSTGFTNSNEVEIVGLEVPEGHTHFQFTEDGDPAALGAWTLTNAIPFSESFAQPTGDTDITLYAWFTNTANSVVLRRANGSITFTTAPPVPSVVPTLTRETGGFTVRMTKADVDADSTGGTALGKSMAVIERELLLTGGPYDDLTPEQPYVTLTNVLDTYEFKLRVVNEAGNVATSSVCEVTLVSAADAPTYGDRYVAVGNLLAQAPYTNWTTAAASIQTAVNAAEEEDRVLIWPGRYTAPTNAVFWEGATNVVYLNKPLSLESVAGPDRTLIDGAGANRGLAINYIGSDLFTFRGLTFTNGFAPSGGGVYVYRRNFTVEFDSCHFIDNTSEGFGGGMVVYSDSTGGPLTAILSNCIFRANRTLDGSAGALWVNWSILTVRDSLFEDNRVDAQTHKSGGAVFLDTLNRLAQFENTIFRFNRASATGNAGTGGGAILFSRTQVVLRNSLLYGNTGYRGSCIHSSNHGANRLTLQNNTFADNGARALHWRGQGTYLRMYNNIFSNNGYRDLDIQAHSTDREFILRNNCYETWVFGTFKETDTVEIEDNLHVNPLFVDSDSRNYRLTSVSPVINKGLNQPEWMTGATDLDGKPRIDGVHNQVDMGAYEYQYPGTILFVR